MLQDFEILSDHFGTLGIQVLKIFLKTWCILLSLTVSTFKSRSVNTHTIFQLQNHNFCCSKIHRNI